MHYVVLLEDNPERAEMRQKHMAAHLAFLADHAANIRAAGPLKNTADGLPAGGIWIVEAETPDEVKARSTRPIRSGRPDCASRCACWSGSASLPTGRRSPDSSGVYRRPEACVA